MECGLTEDKMKTKIVSGKDWMNHTYYAIVEADTRKVLRAGYPTRRMAEATAKRIEDGKEKP